MGPWCRAPHTEMAMVSTSRRQVGTRSRTFAECRGDLDDREKPSGMTREKGGNKGHDALEESEENHVYQGMSRRPVSQKNVP